MWMLIQGKPRTRGEMQIHTYDEIVEG